MAKHEVRLLRFLRDNWLVVLTRWVPHDGYIRHQNDHLSGRMTDISVMGEWQVVGVGGTRPLWNVLGEGIEGQFSFEARNYLFSFRSYVRFEEFFCFPRFWKIWRQMFKLWGFWFRRCFGALFENSAPSPGICLRTLTTTTSISWNFPFFFPKQSRIYLPDSYGDPKSEQSTLVMVRRKPEWKLDFRALARSSAEGPSIVVAIGTSRVRWSMVQKRKKTKNTRKSACDCAKAQPFIIHKPASFEEPASETRRRYRFALRCFRGRGCTAAGRSACSAGTAKKSSHPWHFRCWSLRRNELECTDLVHWTEPFHRFSSRNAIIVVGSVLEKHFDGDFTPDQEKKITFKRWPPGYQSWKLGLALNGLTSKKCNENQKQSTLWKKKKDCTWRRLANFLFLNLDPLFSHIPHTRQRRPLVGDLYSAWASYEK